MMIPKNVLMSLVLFSMVFSSSGYAVSLGKEGDERQQFLSRPLSSSVAGQENELTNMGEGGCFPVSPVLGGGGRAEDSFVKNFVKNVKNNPRCCLGGFLCVFFPTVAVLAGLDIFGAQRGSGLATSPGVICPGSSFPSQFLDGFNQLILKCKGMSEDERSKDHQICGLSVGNCNGLPRYKDVADMIAFFTGAAVPLPLDYAGNAASGKVVFNGQSTWPSTQRTPGPAFIGKKGCKKRALAHSRGTSLLGFVSLLSNVRSTGSSDLKCSAKPKSSLRDRQFENRSGRHVTLPKYPKNVRGKR